jgi:hypothetical protein
MDTSNFTDLSLYRAFIGGLNDDQIESVGKDYTSCWLYALFIHTLVELPISEDGCESIYENHMSIIYDIQTILDQNGIYSFYHINKTEFHHFILIINDEQLQLFSTYGGQKGIIELTFNKIEWINKFLFLFGSETLNENKINLYKSIFGITNEIKELDLSQCIFMYSTIKFDKLY